MKVSRTCRLCHHRIVTSFTFFLWFQGESVKNSSGTGDDAQATYGGRTRSVRPLGTAELIRPQRLKYFESMCHLTILTFLYYVFYSCCFYKKTLNFQYLSSGNDAEEESDEDEDYVPSEDWKKVNTVIVYLNVSPNLELIFDPVVY